MVGSGAGGRIPLARDSAPGDGRGDAAGGATGGVFANLDLVRSASAQLHERFRREIGRTQDDPTDRLADLSEQLAWLREAGFAEAECHFKWLELALFVARRSASS